MPDISAALRGAAGNGEARRVLIVAAWCYRIPARVSSCPLERSSALPKALRDIAWKGQLRLCGRYRELLGFIWARAQAVGPAKIKGEVLSNNRI